MKELGKGMK
jgi:hypothetical protein